jgi:hypothetical protein
MRPDQREKDAPSSDIRVRHSVWRRSTACSADCVTSPGNGKSQAARAEPPMAGTSPVPMGSRQGQGIAPTGGLAFDDAPVRDPRTVTQNWLLRAQSNQKETRNQ